MKRKIATITLALGLWALPALASDTGTDGAADTQAYQAGIQNRYQVRERVSVRQNGDQAGYQAPAGRTPAGRGFGRPDAVTPQNQGTFRGFGRGGRFGRGPRR